MVVSELAPGSNGGLLSSVGQPVELKALDHSLSQFGRWYPPVGLSSCEKTSNGSDLSIENDQAVQRPA